MRYLETEKSGEAKEDVRRCSRMLSAPPAPDDGVELMLEAVRVGLTGVDMVERLLRCLVTFGVGG